jgi:hypothetical protein
MVNTLVTLLGLAAAAGPAWALPSAAAGTLYSKPAEPWSLNHTEISLRPRQAGYNSECDIGEASIITSDRSAGAGQHPAAFAQLFDAVNSELCDNLGCNGFMQKCVTADELSDVCIQVQGDFASADRGYFIDGSRQLFDRTVKLIDFGQDGGIVTGTEDVGTDQVYLRREAGGFIQIQLTQQDKGGQNCGGFVNTIVAVGGLAGEAAPFFGLIGLICSGAVAGTIGG